MRSASALSRKGSLLDVGGGQPHGKRGALIHLAFDGQAAAVLGDQRSTDGEPQAIALGCPFGGEEWLEDALEMIGGDAAAVVSEMHVQATGIHTSRNGQLAALRHRLDGIERQVSYDLCNLVHI